MANAWTLPDEFVAKMTALVPARTNTHPRGGGRKPTPPDRVLRAIFFVLRTGIQWKALDATTLCPGSVAHRFFQEWAASGVFRQMWALALAEYDELKGLDWEWQSLDGAMNKAPLGGGKRRGQTLRIAANAASSAACSPRPRGCLSAWRLTERIGMI